MPENTDTLVWQYWGLVADVARRRFSSRLPDDDLMQCGYIGLWEAAKAWDHVCEFAPYAKISIYHNMLDYVRGFSAIKRRPEEPIEDNEAAEQLTESDLLQMDYIDLCNEFAEVLGINSTEYMVLSQIALNGEIQATAAAIGITGIECHQIAKRAYRAVKRAREANKE